MNRENTLLVFSLSSNRSLNWALSLINSKNQENLWIVVDEKTMKTLARRNIVKTLGEKILVFSGRNFEEFSLRLLVLSKPDEIYVCDERGVLEPVIRLLRALRVSIREC